MRKQHDMLDVLTVCWLQQCTASTNSAGHLWHLRGAPSLQIAAPSNPSLLQCHFAAVASTCAQDERAPTSNTHHEIGGCLQDEVLAPFAFIHFLLQKCVKLRGEASHSVWARNRGRCLSALLLLQSSSTQQSHTTIREVHLILRNCRRDMQRQHWRLSLSGACPQGA